MNNESYFEIKDMYNKVNMLRRKLENKTLTDEESRKLAQLVDMMKIFTSEFDK